LARLIDLEGLPDPVAKAIAETVLNLKIRYCADVSEPPQKLNRRGGGSSIGRTPGHVPPMPSLSDEVPSRESIYASDDNAG